MWVYIKHYKRYALGVVSSRKSNSPEVGAEPAALLQRLREHLVLADVVVGDGAARELHRLLEVRAADLRHRVLLVHLEGQEVIN